MRKAFTDALVEAARSDDRVIFLTGDLGFQVFDPFRQEFGARYVNVGVAEAQLMCAAAGLALEGWRPVVYSIASFVTARPFEQIRISINYHNLPVVIVGAGGGYLYGSDGVTHHAPDDFALMSLLPGMTVVAPGSPEEVKTLFRELLQLDGPSYMRIGKFGEPHYEASDGIVLGKARLISHGSHVAILSTGEMAPIVVRALGVLRSEGITPVAYQFHTIKPLDTETLSRIADEVDSLILIEEATPIAGLSASAMNWLATRKDRPRIVRLGPADTLVIGNADRDSIRRRFGFDAESLAEVCRKEWHSVRRQDG